MGCQNRILKMIATYSFLTVLECTKFVFAHPPGELTTLSQTGDRLAGLRVTLLLRRGDERGEKG